MTRVVLVLYLVVVKTAWTSVSTRFCEAVMCFEFLGCGFRIFLWDLRDNKVYSFGSLVRFGITSWYIKMASPDVSVVIVIIPKP